MSSFESVRTSWPWRPILGCPGRFELPQTATTPAVIAGDEAMVEHHGDTTADDPVWVIRFADGGGLICYDKGDGTFVHTLGDAAGFARKLEWLKIR